MLTSCLLVNYFVWFKIHDIMRYSLTVVDLDRLHYLLALTQSIVVLLQVEKDADNQCQNPGISRHSLPGITSCVAHGDL